ncbi:Lar family restriction alleviation protein [Pseudomonas aeruginosa]
MTSTDPRDALAPCPWCGEQATRVILTHPEPECGEILRQEDYGDGVDGDAQAFCHMCGARCAAVGVTLYTAEDYDEAIALAASTWNDRKGAEVADAAIRADARRYRRLLHEGLRFMAGGKLHQTKAETDAAIDALEPAPASASRM